MLRTILLYGLNEFLYSICNSENIGNLCQLIIQ